MAYSKGGVVSSRGRRLYLKWEVLFGTSKVCSKGGGASGKGRAYTRVEWSLTGKGVGDQDPWVLVHLWPGAGLMIGGLSRLRVGLPTWG